MKDIVLLGIQGSGKGTQGDLLVEKYGLQKFETGKSLRAISSQDTELGKTVKKIMEAGTLVSDQVIFEILEDFFAHLKPGQSVVYDGLPRNKEQYGEFSKVLEMNGRDFVVVLIEISEEEAVKRLSYRKICPNCKRNYPYFYTKSECEVCHIPLIARPDDSNPETVQKRIHVFKNETMPIVEHYKQEGKLIVINGEQSIEEVFAEMEHKLLEAHVLSP